MHETFMNTIGDRITFCRSSLKLTRKDLSEQWKMASVPTIARWELDVVKIPLKKLASLIDFFSSNGLIVTQGWILNQSEAPPILVKNNAFDELDFDSLAQENLLNVNMQEQNFTFGQVKNTLVSPFIKYGDYIGGNSCPFSSLTSVVGDVIFIKRISGIVVGILDKCEDEIILKNLTNHHESFDKSLIESVGRVKWIVRRP